MNRRDFLKATAAGIAVAAASPVPASKAVPVAAPAEGLLRGSVGYWEGIRIIENIPNPLGPKHYIGLNDPEAVKRYSAMLAHDLCKESYLHRRLMEDRTWA